jgi:hypothetical protein
MAGRPKRRARLAREKDKKAPRKSSHSPEEVFTATFGKIRPKDWAKACRLPLYRRGEIERIKAFYRAARSIASQVQRGLYAAPPVPGAGDPFLYGNHYIPVAQALPYDLHDYEIMAVAGEMDVLNRFWDSRSPVWMLEPETALALDRTDPPVDRVTPEIFNRLLRLPYDGLYLKLPPGFLTIPLPHASFPVEGVFLAKSGVRDSAGRVSPSIRATAVGRCPNQPQMFPIPPTMLIELGPNVPSHSGTGSLRREKKESQRLAALVTNFLWAVNTDHLETVPAGPPRGAPGVSRGSHAPTLVKLGRRTRQEDAKRPHAGGTVAPHSVRGHWHSYWVKHPKDRPVVRTREGSARPFLVKNWVLPYFVGSAEKAPDPRYISNPRRHL